MERVIFHTLCMNYKSTLCNAANLFLNALFIGVVKIIISTRENWIRSANDLERLKFTIIADGNETPVVETTLPEFTKVNGHFILRVIFGNDISLLNLVPCE